MRRLCFLLACSLCLVARGAAAEDAAGKLDPAAFRAAVEADWLTQDKVRTGARVQPRAGNPNVSTKQDAAGGVDGIVDGKWGFHTENQPDPWWQVDLGQKTPLGHVALYNRCDNCGDRNNHILLLLSDVKDS